MKENHLYQRWGMQIFSVIIILVLLSRVVSGEKLKTESSPEYRYNNPTALGKIGDNPFPTNPLNDRAKGYLIKGKVKSAVFNYGNFIQWGDYSASSGYNGLPAGMWGDFSYLPSVSFMAGVAGHEYSSNYTWYVCETIQISGSDLKVWCSPDAYEDWFDVLDTNFVGVAFEIEDDRGIVGTFKETKDDIDQRYQWGLDDLSGEVFISVLYDEVNEINPNRAGALIGLIRPWGLRPALKERTDDFDVYDYGSDLEEWTADDNYEFYGATVIESWFTRVSPSTNSEWHAASKARMNSHNTENTAGDLFGDTPYVPDDDPYPVLAHSNYSQTWPTRFNSETGVYEPYWPGWWAEDYNEDLPGCNKTKKDPDCWQPAVGRFVSDSDVYMEFDDRWASRGNMVDTNNDYEQTGYPLGIRVRATAHSYGVAYAEDILFVTVKVRNESGDWTDENGFHEAMIMPDGTKLNQGKGFNYKDVFLGFYMDADVLSLDVNGGSAYHTNDDDFMKYYWEIFDVNNETMLISMAMIGDYDGVSNAAAGYSMEDGVFIGRDFGIVATQLLDSPLATSPVDLNQDGEIDIFAGEPLKMTDWHWFDWYTRPGVTGQESNNNCCAGEKGRAQARNKDEILLKVMSGDTTNLSDNENAWHFHTAFPETDLAIDLNPHFDSIKGLEQEPAFLQDPPGLDCVLLLSCGPFDFSVGEEVPFSFCIIFGQDTTDLIQNARFAQIMYNSHYQGYTAPTIPNVTAKTEHGSVTIMWDDVAERSNDVVTGYADFEGYKIYKSTDGGKTWGQPEDKILDDYGIHVGWHPVAQWDLTEKEDSLYCVYANDECHDSPNRGHSISGKDPHAPWFDLGSDTGLPDKTNDGLYYWVDTDVKDGREYTYSVTSYDMGVEAPVKVSYLADGSGGYTQVSDTAMSNPNFWSAPNGYQSIENSKGTTIQDANFITVIPGPIAVMTLADVKVVPNPYIVRSDFNETEYVRKIMFTNLPVQCTISIFTVTGEKVISFDHDSASSGIEFWNLRSMNNQEIAPGLYVYVVEAGDDKHIGKFAFVR